MAGTARTDLAAVSILTGDQTASATAAGVNLKSLQNALDRKLVDAAFLAKTIDNFLPAGTAKTAFAAVLLDLT